MEAKNLRIGNYLFDRNENLCRVEELGKNYIYAPREKGAITGLPNKPIPLTEETIKNLRINGRREFWDRPPGERQIEKQYYSFEIDLTRLHLCPSYAYKMKNGERTKGNVPEFWFCWIEAYGTGSGKFLPIQPISKNKLEYVHQLQNLFFAITGNELEYMEKVSA